MIFDKKKHTHRRKPLMAILQLIAEKEKSLCFDFLEEKIREESRKLIESIYADEVNQFLEKMAAVVDGKGNRLVVRNGYHKSRIVQTACGNYDYPAEHWIHIRTTNPIESTLELFLEFLSFRLLDL